MKILVIFCFEDFFISLKYHGTLLHVIKNLYFHFQTDLPTHNKKYLARAT